MGNHPSKEKTLVIIKPDGIQRSLVGEIIRRYERVGLKLVVMRGWKKLVEKPGLLMKRKACNLRMRLTWKMAKQ